MVLISDLNSAASQAAIASVLSQDANLGYLASGYEPDQAYYRGAQVQYARLGMGLDYYLDLELGYTQAGLDRLLNCQAIHLAGGDTFQFLAQVQTRGLMAEFTDYLNRGGIFIGLSAGAMLMTPSIACAPLCGDENHLGLSDLNGLGLFPYQFLPHCDLSDGGVALSVKAACLMEASSLAEYPLILCSDEDAVIATKTGLRGFGQPLLFDGVGLMALA
ncbi:Type 1 glutamine amidotransferase-like domain-containing protein [Shewanella insulae]|uniref:Type 1 glutamine amidotransferase-like domain-containing protein n=1 Tax=Shewanella insulae TaxID=2681496 RepID=UPI001EFCB52C|nr:Type 1 glutamine amidotransferase-like domain-containing protein [Shewanella insulae]MCG9756051.1 Type 1 glutamine amidotransferase-like domain-containing protein [Shewanella insulae]